jgi:hypothetical protein
LGKITKLLVGLEDITDKKNRDRTSGQSEEINRKINKAFFS